MQDLCTSDGHKLSAHGYVRPNPLSDEKRKASVQVQGGKSKDICILQICSTLPDQTAKQGLAGLVHSYLLFSWTIAGRRSVGFVRA